MEVRQGSLSCPTRGLGHSWAHPEGTPRPCTGRGGWGSQGLFVHPYPRLSLSQGKRWLQPCPLPLGLGGCRTPKICPCPSIQLDTPPAPQGGEGRETRTDRGTSSQDRWTHGKPRGWLDSGGDTWTGHLWAGHIFMSSWTPGHVSVHPCVHLSSCLLPSLEGLEDSGQAALSSWTHGRGVWISTGNGWTDRRMDGRTDGHRDGLTDTDKDMSSWTHGQFCGWTHGWLH